MGKKVYGSNTIFFITKSQVPQDQKVTYGRIVCEIKPKKDENYRTRLTVGVNIIDYLSEVANTKSDITTVKNSPIEPSQHLIPYLCVQI